MDELKKNKRSSMKCSSDSFNYFSNLNITNIKKIKFDESSLALKNKLSKRVLKEPKTPYVEYEGDDDDYLKKIKQINNLDPAVCIYLT